MAREWWIFKGSSNFCQEFVMADDYETMVKQKPDGFYDIVSTRDTVEGGIPVIEKQAYLDLLAQAEKMAEALKAIHENASEVQPNSGWMYLSNVNYCYKKADHALSDWLKFREGKDGL